MAIAAGMAWSGFGAAPASAQSPGLKFSIGIPGLPGCDTRNQTAVCTLAPGTTFVVDVNLDSPPDESPRYSGFDISLRFSGVTRQGEPKMDAWPACAITAVGPARSDGLLFGCAAGLPSGTSSSYTGPIATVSFSCTQSGSVSLEHDNTDLTDSGGNAYTEGSGATDKLTINCQAGGAQPTPPTAVPVRDTPTFPSGDVPPPTAAEPSSTPAGSTGTPAMTATTATPSPTPGGGKRDNGGGGVNGGLIAIIVIVAVAGTGGLGFLGWRYRQGRGGAGGGT